MASSKQTRGTLTNDELVRLLALIKRSDMWS